MGFLEKLKNCQNGTFEPVHEIWKNIHNMPQGPPNPGFMQEKVQKGDFLKKPLRELKFFVVLGSYESLKGLER